MQLSTDGGGDRLRCVCPVHCHRDTASDGGREGADNKHMQGGEVDISEDNIDVNVSPVNYWTSAVATTVWWSA